MNRPIPIPLRRSRRRAWPTSALVAALLSFPIAGLPAESVDPRAADFASHGFAETIAGCRLPKTCRGRTARTDRKGPITETGNDNIIEEHVVRFDGLEITFLYVFGNAAEPRPDDWKKGDPYPPPYITNMKITSGDWPVRHGLRVGTPRAVVEKALGALHVLDDGCARFTDDATMADATLCFDKGRLRSLEWSPWWDG